VSTLPGFLVSFDGGRAERHADGLAEGGLSPEGTTLSELIGVAGRRWGIEECFAIAKSEAGLDEHQVRRWTAWYRHAILSMLAAALLAVARARVPANPTAWQAG
jgi:hypothetical protein